MVRLLNTRTPTGRENKSSRGPRVRHSQSNVSAIRGSEAVFNQPATRSRNPHGPRVAKRDGPENSRVHFQLFLCY